MGLTGPAAFGPWGVAGAAHGGHGSVVQEDGVAAAFNARVLQIAIAVQDKPHHGLASGALQTGFAPGGIAFVGIEQGADTDDIRVFNGCA